MSKAAKSSLGSDLGAEPQVTFEEALKKLEAIVDAMESSDLPLETLLARFEEGAKLADMCQARLADAELKIQQLERTALGQFVTKPLPTAAEPSET